MGVQDTGCLNNVPSGDGLIRNTNGSCSYYADSAYVSTNFRMDEFRSVPVGTPYGVMQLLVERLQNMRNVLGTINVTQGYAQLSDPHGSGLAADISVPGKTFIQVAQAAYNAGFTRIEVQKPSGTSFSNDMSVGGHVHVDVYDGSGASTSGTEYDCPSCSPAPCATWYAWGVQNSWWATSQPNTFSQLLSNLQSDKGNTGYTGC